MSTTHVRIDCAKHGMKFCTNSEHEIDDLRAENVRLTARVEELEQGFVETAPWVVAAQDVVNLFDPLKAKVSPVSLLFAMKGVKAANTSLRAEVESLKAQLADQCRITTDIECERGAAEEQLRVAREALAFWMSGHPAETILGLRKALERIAALWNPEVARGIALTALSASTPKAETCGACGIPSNIHGLLQPAPCEPKKAEPECGAQAGYLFCALPTSHEGDCKPSEYVERADLMRVAEAVREACAKNVLDRVWARCVRLTDLAAIVSKVAP